MGTEWHSSPSGLTKLPPDIRFFLFLENFLEILLGPSGFWEKLYANGQAEAIHPILAHSLTNSQTLKP